MRGIITCMTCMSVAALTMGGPIRRPVSQSEKNVLIGGKVALLCPLVPNDLWKWVYWKKNGNTIYSHEVKSNTSWTNDTRYEGSNHATRLTIKDLKKTDGGTYYCKVATLLFIKERGHVLLSVTDQEVGLSTTSPGVSTMIPPQPGEDSTDIFFEFSTSLIVKCLVSILIITAIINFITHLFKMYRERIASASRIQADKSTSTPLDTDSSHLEIGDEAPRRSSTSSGPDSSHHEIRDKEGTRTNLLSSDTHDRDDVDVDDRPEEKSNASELKL